MTSEHSGEPLRRRVLVSILTVTTLAVVLFALPLGLAVQRLYRTEAVTALQQEATRVAAVVPDGIPGAAVRLPRGAAWQASVVGVYDTAGRRVAGSGPSRSVLAAASGKSQVRTAIEGVDLAVVAPIPSDQKAAGAVRAAVPYISVTERVYRAWVAMALFALAALALAVLVARRQAVRLAAPLERLTIAARALGDGDFTIRAEHSGVREADSASQALQDTATHLGGLIERQQAFSSDISHQLRTPITALMVGLESALARPGADPRSALQDALARSEHLSTIVEDLLSLARQPGFVAIPVDTGALLEDIRARWDAPLASRGRRLAAAAEPGMTRCLAPAAAVRQILDVLISNALWHGDGTVTIEACEAGPVVAIDVSDEGPGLPDGLPASPAELADGHGRGLALAHSLASAAGGRLELRRSAPCPVFRLSLPAAASDQTASQDAAGTSKR
ncbi:MAG TPA: histidine kinase dimerization/phospho-acceptor domain-containing protein [Streptosporangiaceae bacterium]|jgi:signal transduction histidine kinase|nr:histidine kinase dimerization/phospho-acceptor domain-containing protein [Streptosporangiaceae bacterium]